MKPPKANYPLLAVAAIVAAFWAVVIAWAV